MPVCKHLPCDDIVPLPRKNAPLSRKSTGMICWNWDYRSNL
ncbi:MAG: hypothetical protein NT118_07590 [Lentisphaerae bacterium]|nr:hypothetical protein [Lentisphaerota bacterium]